MANETEPQSLNNSVQFCVTYFILNKNLQRINVAKGASIVSAVAFNAGAVIRGHRAISSDAAA